MPKPKSLPTSERSIPTERTFEVVEHRDGAISARPDAVVVEEPMEIRIVFGPMDGRIMRSVSITMRTPGHDDELAVGFLFTEGLVKQPDQIENIDASGVDADGKPTGNIVRVHLRPGTPFDPARLQRNFLTTSSCGVCGKASLEAIAIEGLERLPAGRFSTAAGIVHTLPELLRHEQATFSRTGGLHGSALFDANGHLICVREDVGRHNAVDKLIGRAFLDGQTALEQAGLIVSGRVSFEILQKALMARIPMIVSVGAPTSLAVETAQHYNLTLIGFASASRFNVYSAPDRIVAKA